MPPWSIRAHSQQVEQFCVMPQDDPPRLPRWMWEAGQKAEDKTKSSFLVERTPYVSE